MKNQIGNYIFHVLYLTPSQIKSFGESYIVTQDYKNLKSKKRFKVFLTKTQIKKLNKVKSNKGKVDLKFSKTQFKKTLDYIKEINSDVLAYSINHVGKSKEYYRLRPYFEDPSKLKMFIYNPKTNKFELPYKYTTNQPTLLTYEPKKPKLPRVNNSLITQRTKDRLETLKTKNAKKAKKAKKLKLQDCLETLKTENAKKAKKAKKLKKLKINYNTFTKNTLKKYKGNPYKPPRTWNPIHGPNFELIHEALNKFKSRKKKPNSKKSIWDVVVLPKMYKI